MSDLRPSGFNFSVRFRNNISTHALQTLVVGNFLHKFDLHFYLKKKQTLLHRVEEVVQFLIPIQGINMTYTNKCNCYLFVAWRDGKPFIAVLVLYKL